jgi:hypothetical protein
MVRAGGVPGLKPITLEVALRDAAARLRGWPRKKVAVRSQEFAVRGISLVVPLPYRTRPGRTADHCPKPSRPLPMSQPSRS